MSRLLLPAPAFPAALRRGAARLARLGTCMTLIGTACALPAQTLTGLYARGKTHDALFATSDASGDLIGYAVAHGSPLAKALARRLDGETAPALQQSLAALQRTLQEVQGTMGQDSPLNYNLKKTLEELALTLRSLRELTTAIESRPQSLLFGKGEKEDEK